MRNAGFVLLSVIATLAGCASQPAPRPVAVMAPPIVTAASATFNGYGNLVPPPRLADGSFSTPNRNVSAAGAVWNLRAGLNVAALSCRGAEEAALVAGYNALLQRHRGPFDQAYRALAREHGDAAGFDRAMTALYNYFALPPAKPGLCAAARHVLAATALLPDDGLSAAAPGALAELERPYTQVFAAQAAWLASRPAPAAVIAAAASAPRGTSDTAALHIP